MKINSNKKGFSFSALIMAIAVFFGFGAHVAPTTLPVVSTSTEITATTSIVIEHQNNIATSTEGWKTYTNSQYGFSLQYPNDFVLTSDLTSLQQQAITSYMGTCSPSAIRLCYVGNKMDGFTSAALTISLSTSTNQIACQNFGVNEMNSSGQQSQQKNFNNVVFNENMTSRAGLGHYISTDSYTTYRSGACYKIDLQIESDRGTSGKGIDPIFSKTIMDKLNSILSTLKFIN